MIKLYKELEDILHFWEAWIDGEMVVVHQGVVGKRGKIDRKKPGLFSSHEKTIAKLSQRPRKSGFNDIPIEDQWTLIIQQRMTGNNDADLDQRNDLIDGLNNTLGWIGAGHVDGGDIGSGTVNIFAFIVAPQQTNPAIIQWLEQQGELAKSVVAIESPDESEPITVIWPRDFDGQFSILGN